MKFSIPRESFLAELQLLQAIVEKRNTMPILANILIDAGPAEVEMTGTDLEVGLRTKVGATVGESGAVTVNGKKLFEIVKSLPQGADVQVGSSEVQIVIRAGESEFRVHGLPKEDYPQVPEPKFEKGISLGLKGFQEMIDLVLYAITQEQRYYLNGALLCLKKGQVELVSTDGHRLSYTKRADDGLTVDREASVIVAKKTLGEIKKLEGETLEFDQDENNLFFRAGQRTLISRIIESKFPNYQAVIPKENPLRLTVGRAELADAIRRVALLSAERSKGIKFTMEKSHMKLFSSNPEIGEATDRLAVDYKGGSLEIGFNAQYLLDFLASGASEKVVFEIKDENSAVLIKPEDGGTTSNLYVLMPMKI